MLHLSDEEANHIDFGTDDFVCCGNYWLTALLESSEL